jgi:hypothetical protein
MDQGSRTEEYCVPVALTIDAHIRGQLKVPNPVLGQKTVCCTDGSLPLEWLNMPAGPEQELHHFAFYHEPVPCGAWLLTIVIPVSGWRRQFYFLRARGDLDLAYLAG